LALLHLDIGRNVSIAGSSAGRVRGGSEQRDVVCCRVRANICLLTLKHLYDDSLCPAGMCVNREPAVNDSLVVDAHVTAITACCPDCGVCTPHIHSHYRRTSRDVPVSTRRVQLRLRVRRFFCDQSACARHTFAEQLRELLSPKAQRTSRLTATLHDIGVSLGASAGATLASRLCIRISPYTIARWK
jgi:hypothetical protein